MLLGPGFGAEAEQPAQFAGMPDEVVAPAVGTGSWNLGGACWTVWLRLTFCVGIITNGEPGSWFMVVA